MDTMVYWWLPGWVPLRYGSGNRTSAVRPRSKGPDLTPRSSRKVEVYGPERTDKVRNLRTDRSNNVVVQGPTPLPRVNRDKLTDKESPLHI